MSRRKLTPDEQELWRKVARTTDRLHDKPITRIPKNYDFKQAVERTAQPTVPLEFDSKPAKKPEPRKYPTEARNTGGSHAITMDYKAYAKLRRGKLNPESRIDLHGMTLARAQPALTGFILRAQGQGKRLVLVITGKGRNSPDEGPIPVRRGILRHAVPQWLRSSPLDGIVLQISEAHAKHGGAGAFYVYLRRSR